MRTLLMGVLLSDPVKTAEALAEAKALDSGAAILRLLSSGPLAFIGSLHQPRNQE